MASKEHKIIRRAQAMTELSRLSGLLAEHLNIEAPVIEAGNRDAELAEIQRIENINGMLAQILEASKTQDDSAKKSAGKVKHGAVK
jgi:nitrate reductase NapAB chaperone NapD